MVEAGAVQDYTFLVGRASPRTSARSSRAPRRPDPARHTIAITALIQAMCEGARRSTSSRDSRVGTFPHELLEENKWLAARYGMRAS